VSPELIEEPSHFLVVPVGRNPELLILIDLIVFEIQGIVEIEAGETRVFTDHGGANDVENVVVVPVVSARDGVRAVARNFDPSRAEYGIVIALPSRQRDVLVPVSVGIACQTKSCALP